MNLLRAPFPYIGSKRKAARLVWGVLGNPRVYIEPFFGSGAALLARPDEPMFETVNDVDGLVCNVWRAITYRPDETARHADFPISELDLTARHRDLVLWARKKQFKKRLEADPEWCDPKRAGWWIWGASQWIGKGWCADKDDVGRQIPQVHGIGGTGVHGHRVERGEGIRKWFDALAARTRRVRFVCGDFERVLTKSTLYCEGSNVAGVFLDPPYSPDLCEGDMYAHDDPDASRRAREWAIAHGDDPKLRIVLAGLEGEHAMPDNWRVLSWEGHFGLGRSEGNDNRLRERLWVSPHCLGRDGPLFERKNTHAEAAEASDG